MAYKQKRRSLHREPESFKDFFYCPMEINNHLFEYAEDPTRLCWILIYTLGILGCFASISGISSMTGWSWYSGRENSVTIDTVFIICGAVMFCGSVFLSVAGVIGKQARNELSRWKKKNRLNREFKKMNKKTIKEKFHQGREYDLQRKVSKSCIDVLSNIMHVEYVFDVDWAEKNMNRFVEVLSFGKESRRVPVVNAERIDGKDDIEEELREYITVVRDLVKIWRYGLHLHTTLVLNVRENNEALETLEDMGNAFGLEPMIECYYMGVPVEDIIA